MKQKRSLDVDQTFDNVNDALYFIDQLAKHKKHGKLSNNLIEATHDRMGRIKEGLYEWKVAQ